MLMDINVLVYAHRTDSIHNHQEYADWLKQRVMSSSKFAVSEAVLSGFIRVVTNNRIFKNPTPINTAMDFCEKFRSRTNAMVLRPGPENWNIFMDLCRKGNASGKLVSDAWHAALAIEYDCEWITCDSDFARFPGLSWRHPLATDA